MFSQIPQAVRLIAGVEDSVNNKRKKGSTSIIDNKKRAKSKTTNKKLQNEHINSPPVFSSKFDYIDEEEEVDVVNREDIDICNMKNEQNCVLDTTEITNVERSNDNLALQEESKTCKYDNTNQQTKDSIIQVDLLPKPVLVDKGTQTDIPYEKYVTSLQQKSLSEPVKNRKYPPLKWGQSMGISKKLRKVRYPSSDPTYSPPRAPAC